MSLTDSLAPVLAIESHPRTTVTDPHARPESPGIRSSGWTDEDAHHLLAHLDRDAFQASATRDFSHAWRKDPATAETTPKLYPVGSRHLQRAQYAVLTHPQRAAVLVIDLDHPTGVQGGQVTAIQPKVHTQLDRLAVAGFGPSWVGVNPLSGKAQALWLIDPVYAAKDRRSSNMALLAVATDELNAVLGGDRSFSHRFSRWPLHRSGDPTAYRWHCQHHQVVRLRDLIDHLREMTNRPQHQPRPQYESGRARIEAARRATAEAKARAASEDASQLSPAAAGIIDGVRVLWQSDGRAARDETAFRHALVTGHRLRAKGERLTDAALIDAYEQAYAIAQAVGADYREPDMPPMRDRLTMARRIRSYVTRGGTSTTNTSSRTDSAGRKALATMGARGGKTAAKRWNDPESEYARQQRAALAAANKRKSVSSHRRGYEIADWYLDRRQRTGEWPTLADGMAVHSVSRETIKRALKAANIELPRGRRQTTAEKGSHRKQ